MGQEFSLRAVETSAQSLTKLQSRCGTAAFSPGDKEE